MREFQKVSPQIEDVVDTLDERASGPAFNDWTENRWGGMDFMESGLLVGRMIRLTDDDGTIDLLVLTPNGVILWKAHFDNAPAAVVAAAVLEALR